jgi:hypothetical protein
MEGSYTSLDVNGVHGVRGNRSLCELPKTKMGV